MTCRTYCWSDLKGMTLLCDIGNGTMNLMYLRDGDAIPDKMYTEKFGTQQCVNAMPICMKTDKVGNHWEKRGQ